MNYNYHTHTYRCRHASGTEEEYIIRAIENGIKYMGFADHAPLKFDDGFESGYRVSVSDVDDYFSVLTALREKYKDQIDIKLGFEMEYYPEIFETMLENVKGYGAEYLILGEHYVTAEHPNPLPHTSIANDSEELLKKYAETVVEGIKTGVFTYVAHPDVINFTGDTDVYKKEMRKICKASREYGIPLEINFLGIRDNRNYPNPTFWEMAGEEQCPVTFGFDAHDVLSAYDGESLSKAKEMVEKFNLNYIGKPEVILIQNL